jgi:hypothetical protein
MKNWFNMKKIARIIGLALTSTFLFVACSTKEKTESNQASKDSILANNSASASQPVQTPEDSSDFGKFIQTFDSPGTEISPDILSALSVNNEFGRYTSEEILRQDSIVFVLFTHMKQVGPGINELHAATFSKDGNLIEESLLGSSYPSSGPDGGGKDYNYRYDAQRKILYVTNSTIEWDESAQEEVTTEALHYFQLTSDGKLENVNPREYPEVSERLLEKGELTDKTKEVLMIMRNEPFAVYGYIFKNKFLKSHFSSKAWYNPQFNNVSDQLSEIEKANIQLIKEVEDSK